MPAPDPLRLPSARAIAVAALGLAAAIGAVAAPADELDARIETLERQLADDEAVLSDYLTDPDAARRLLESREIDAIAERLPRRQQELRTLRARRDGGGDADAP